LPTSYQFFGKRFKCDLLKLPGWYSACEYEREPVKDRPNYALGSSEPLTGGQVGSFSNYFGSRNHVVCIANKWGALTASLMALIQRVSELNITRGLARYCYK